MAEIEYAPVYDQGGNLGIKCSVCGRAHWDADPKVKDWSTGEDCKGCVEIRDNKIWEKEVQRYLPVQKEVNDILSKEFGKRTKLEQDKLKEWEKKLPKDRRNQLKEERRKDEEEKENARLEAEKRKEKNAKK